MEITDLDSRRVLVIGIVDHHGLARAFAQRYRSAGAELTTMYLDDKAEAIRVE